MSAWPALPVHLVTGFLGAGKTTLINALLRDPVLQGALVIVNEFGEIGLDHWLYEKLDGDVALIASGCLCCEMRGDFADTLRALLAKRDAETLPPFSRILVETSGLADPAPILYALIADPELSRRLRLANVTTLVDAVNGAATLAAHPEARRQLALADIVAISKRDLVGDATELEVLVRDIQPAARLLAQVGAADLIDERLTLPVAQRASRFASHSTDVRAFAFAQDGPVEPLALQRFLSALGALAGPGLLRLKALIATRDEPQRPLVIDAVQHLVHPPRRLAHWPEGASGAKAVFVIDGVAQREVDALWRGLIGAPQIDEPDLAALAENPLVPRLGGLFG